MMNKIPRLILLVFFLLASMDVSPVSGQEDPGFQPEPAWINADTVLFLPMVASPYSGFMVSGQVTDDLGNPLGGVLIQDGTGNTTTTATDGSYNIPVDSAQSEYSFSPLMDELGFAPSVFDVDVQDSISNLDFTGMSGCAELIENGGFEGTGVWELSNAELSSLTINTGGRSLELGGDVGISSALSPVIGIPTESENPLLRLWLYPKSITPSSSAATKPSESDTFFGPDEDLNDLQAVQVLLANGTPIENSLGGEWGE